MTPLPSADSFQKTLREIRLAARQRRIFYVSVITVFALTALLGAKPVYHQMKRGRASHFAAAGDAFFAEQHWPDAAGKYRAALQLDPGNVVALRGAARLGARIGQAEAMEFWKQISGRVKLTAADHRLYASLALRAGKLDVAEAEIAGLVKTDPDAETLALAAKFFLQQDNLPKALEFARAAAKTAPQDDARRFELANVLARSPDAEGRTEARTILWTMTAPESASRPAALEALAAAPDLPLDEQKLLVTALRSLPHLSAKDDLLAAGLTINLDPADAGAVYDAAIAKWRDGSLEERVQLGRWLNSAGQFSRVLLLVPFNATVASEELLLVQLDALAGLKQWDEIEQVLARKNQPLDTTVAESFRARAAQERNLPLDADLHWNRALTNARNDSAKLRFLANFAEQSRAPDQALKIYEQLTRFPREASQACRAAQRLLTRNGDVIGLLAVTEKLAALEPNNADVKNESAYLRLLLERDLKAANETAANLAALRPDKLAFRVTRALGLLRLRRAREALRNFDAPAPIDWQKTPPAWRAIYAAVLAANNDLAHAREIAAGIPVEALKPQEKALIASLLPATP